MTKSAVDKSAVASGLDPLRELTSEHLLPMPPASECSRALALELPTPPISEPSGDDLGKALVCLAKTSMSVGGSLLAALELPAPPISEPSGDDLGKALVCLEKASSSVGSSLLTLELPAPPMSEPIGDDLGLDEVSISVGAWNCWR
jgi:hypothetical protein